MTNSSCWHALQSAWQVMRLLCTPSQGTEGKLREIERKKSALELALGDLRQKLDSTRGEVLQKDRTLRAANRSIM